MNLIPIFAIFSLVVFIVLAYYGSEKSKANDKKIFEKLQSEKGKMIDNSHFINFIAEEFNLNLKQNVKIEKPTVIQRRGLSLCKPRGLLLIGRPLVS